MFFHNSTFFKKSEKETKWHGMATDDKAPSCTGFRKQLVLACVTCKCGEEIFSHIHDACGIISYNIQLNPYDAKISSFNVFLKRIFHKR